MGAESDDLAVVDPELRVRGIDALSIVDGSIFPTMPTVNPVVATFMIGERAADLIRQRNG
jgi:choline dehydrogenase